MRKPSKSYFCSQHDNETVSCHFYCYNGVGGSFSTLPQGRSRKEKEQKKRKSTRFSTIRSFSGSNMHEAGCLLELIDTSLVVDWGVIDWGVVAITSYSAVVHVVSNEVHMPSSDRCKGR